VDGLLLSRIPGRSARSRDAYELACCSGGAGCFTVAYRPRRKVAEMGSNFFFLLAVDLLRILCRRSRLARSAAVRNIFFCRSHLGLMWAFHFFAARASSGLPSWTYLFDEFLVQLHFSSLLFRRPCHITGLVCFLWRQTDASNMW